MTRAQRIEAAAQALADVTGPFGDDHKEAIFWLRAALSLPPDAPDEYRRGIEDAAKFVSRWDLTRVFTRPWRDELTDAIRALVADATAKGKP